MKSREPLIEALKSYRLFWMICGALFLVNLFFYFFFLASQSGKTARLHSQFQAEREKVTELRKRQADVDRFRALQTAWQAFAESLPAKIQFPERIQALNQLLGQNQLNAADLSFRSEPMIDANLVRFSTALQTSGSYAAVKRFIAELQAMEGLFCIHKLEFRRSGDRLLEMDMELSAYFRNE